MSRLTQTTWALAAMLWVGGAAQAATSAEINPFASTQLQVDARMARIQQEVDRLRAAGNFAAANDLSSRLSHFQLERAGLQGSLIPGPELDAVGMYTANGDTPVIEVRPTNRPVVLALGAYERVHWTLQVAPGANLQKVIVSGYDGVDMPSGVPAGVPVEMSSYATDPRSFFYFQSKSDRSFTDAAKTLYDKTGLPPSTMQGLYSYLGQHFAVGGGTEWTEERVLTELQPLYKEATAYQLAQDRLAADAYRFTGLTNAYSSSGTLLGRRIAQLTPLRAVEGTVQPRILSYKEIAVDPRGPTYYAFSSSLNKPVTFDPVSGVETALPAATVPLGTGLSSTFDTKRNRAVFGGRGGDPPAYGLSFFNPAAGTWSRSPLSGSIFNASSLTYSALSDAYFFLESGANGAAKLDRVDATTLARTQIELSQFIRCDDVVNPCQLDASGDRLVLIGPSAVDLYEPLLPAVQHSYLIDPANGNVTILGAVPEPGALGLLVFVGAALLRRRGGPRRDTKVSIH